MHIVNQRKVADRDEGADYPEPRDVVIENDLKSPVDAGIEIWDSHGNTVVNETVDLLPNRNIVLSSYLRGEGEHRISVTTETGEVSQEISLKEGYGDVYVHVGEDGGVDITQGVE
ncbi:MAG: hypothetical protein ABEK59_12095 [Halobacteria archaeon]